MTKFNENYFKTQNYQKVTFGKYSMYWWSNRFFSRLVLNYTSKGGEYLELGSGLGDIIFNLSKVDHFSRLTGVDISQYATNQAKEKTTSATFICSPIEKVTFSPRTFDLILSKHVFEHLENPKDTLLKVHDWLKPGGVFIMVTPNLDCLLKPLKGKNWHGYTDKTHISLKTPQEWQLLLEQAGFSLLKEFSDGFWNTPYLPLIPNIIQKPLFGLMGGFQAIIGIPFIPVRLGESIIIITRKN